MLGYIVIAIAISISSTNAQYDAPNDTASCVNALVEWCNGMRYPTEGAGISMVSVTIAEPDGYYRALCTADSDGTNCTRNGSPWFNCSKKNQLFYKGKPLTKNSTDNADDEICKTVDRAFNDLFVQNLSYDNTTLKKEVEVGMEKFFKAIAEMQDEIEAMQAKMFNIFGGGGGFPYRNQDSFPLPDESPRDTQPGDNQRETE